MPMFSRLGAPVAVQPMEARLCRGGSNFRAYGTARAVTRIYTSVPRQFEAKICCFEAH